MLYYNINTTTEYVDASLIKDKLFGEIVFVNPAKRDDFSQLYAHLGIPLKECFRVTQIFGDSCSILYRHKVYKVDTSLLLTRNHDYKPY